MEPPDDAPRTTGAFRAGLKQELPLWRAEGLVDERAERALVERYRLDEKATDLTTAAIYTLGALLVGGGVISFIAWNWDRVPDGMKLFLVGATMLTSHLVGYRLWRVTGSWPRAGHALVLVGTLVYGAGLGLAAQIYNVHSNWFMGVGAWAAGAAVAGWALRSMPNAILAVLLAGIWGAGFSAEIEAARPLAAFVIAAVFGPLAWIERSRVLFAVTVCAVALALGIAAGTEASEVCSVVTVELALAAALIAWPYAFRAGSRGAYLGGTARAFGLLGYGVLAYSASFREVADELSFVKLDHGDGLRWAFTAGAILLVAPAFVVAGMLRGWDPETTPRSRAPSLAALVGVALLLASMTAQDSEVPTAVAGNLALAVPAFLGLVAAMRDLERSTFWICTLTLGLLVVSRFFEFDTNLGVKAAAFVAAGVAVLLVGVAFERRLRAGRPG